MEILLNLLTVDTFLFVFLGTFAGIAVGVMPGLSGPTGVALLLPFTFTMSPLNALLLLSGVYMGSSFGGSITAILLNAPGTESAAATSLEGYPLMRQGRAKEAIYIALFASFIGGLCGVLTLIFFTPLLAKLALKFGPPEMFLLSLTGLAIIGALSGKNLIKGVIAGAIGILFSTVGMDLMTGASRLTYNSLDLEGGLSLVSCLVGFFAISEMISQAINAKKSTLSEVPQQNIAFTKIAKEVFSQPVNLGKSSILGTIIGVMPGAGAAVACFISYAEAMRSSKHPEKFGTGCTEGIIAAESANNAAVGGSLVPLLALGIPGSTTCAILFGALTIHGLFPGPRLFLEHADVVYSFMFGMLLTVFAMLIIGKMGTTWFSKISLIPLKILVPVVILLCFVGAYSIRYSVFDIFTTICFGVLGVIYSKIGVPVAPTVLGIILGPICEQGFRQSLVVASAQDTNILQYLFMRPMAVVLVILLVVILKTSIQSAKAQQKLLAEPIMNTE